MMADTLNDPQPRNETPPPVRLDLGRRIIPVATGIGLRLPPSYLVDEIAREEWDRVSAALCNEGLASAAQRSLLAAYCSAVALAVRAEQILAVEGRYYETRTKRGSIMRRRHPAAHDAEQGWTSARRLAKQLGLTGGPRGEQRTHDPRRSLFK